MEEEAHNREHSASVLVVDDEVEMGSLLKDILEKDGHEVEVVTGGRAAIEKISEKSYPVVIADIKMPDVDGMEVLSYAREKSPESAVIMITAFGSIDLAVETMRKGAYDFFSKPFTNNDEIRNRVRNAAQLYRLKRENIQLRNEVHQRYRYGNIIGKSPSMKRVFEIISRVSPTSSNVLVLGESGTGKELVAKAVHYNGPRNDKPFIPINCAAIPDGLLESELFGHVKGAFTGAVASHRGMLLDAQNGTVFLDEIAEMGQALQAKILRVIEDKEVRPVGGSEPRTIDVRIIAATQKNLREEISKGNFREDLYYRLNVIPIHLPPLRERREDIPLLAEHFLTKYSEQMNTSLKRLSREAMAKLMTHDWQGNVRELENLIERSLVLCQSDVIGPDELAFEPSEDSPKLVEKAVNEDMTLEELEDTYIREVLKKTGGKKELAAKILGINRRTLYRKQSKLSEKDEEAEPSP